MVKLALRSSELCGSSRPKMGPSISSGGAFSLCNTSATARTLGGEVFCCRYWELKVSRESSGVSKLSRDCLTIISNGSANGWSSDETGTYVSHHGQHDVARRYIRLCLKSTIRTWSPGSLVSRDWAFKSAFAAWRYFSVYNLNVECEEYWIIERTSSNRNIVDW